MASPWQSQRRVLWEVVQEMTREELVSNYSGNTSMRLRGTTTEGLVLVTPSRFSYREMRPEDLIVMDLEGEPVEESHMPSSESGLHMAIYRSRPDVGGIVHTHSVYASVAAVAGLTIPPLLDEMVVVLGGEVRVAEYAFPGTEELSHNALEALQNRKAVLLRNHGVVGVGKGPWEALEACRLVEHVAQVFTFASLLGRAYPLPSWVVEAERSVYRMSQEVEAQDGGENC